MSALWTIHGKTVLRAAISGLSPLKRTSRLTPDQNLPAACSIAGMLTEPSYFRGERLASAGSVMEPATAKRNSRVGAVRIAI